MGSPKGRSNQRGRTPTPVNRGVAAPVPGTPKARGTGMDLTGEEEIEFAKAADAVTSPGGTTKTWAELAKGGNLLAAAKKARMVEQVPTKTMTEATATPAPATTTANMTTTTATVVTPEVTTTMDTGDEIQLPPTPPRLRLHPSMLSYDCKYVTYFDLKVPVGNSGSQAGLFNKLGLFCKAVYQKDKEMKLFPYLLEDRKQAHIVIQDEASWTDAMRSRRLSILQKYFHNAMPHGRDGHRTVQLLLGTSVDPKSLMLDIGEFLRPPKTEPHFFWHMFIRQLQAEDTMCIGWLYLSTSSMDTKTLQEKIQEEVGFPVGLQYRIITPAKTNDKKKPEDVRAIHVIVDSRNATADKEVLAAMYSPNRTEGWPLGIRMRFVQDASNVSGHEDPGNLAKMRRRQAYHQGRIKTIVSTDFDDVDKKCSVLKKTLRQFIMAIPSSNPETPLILSIMPEKKGGGYGLQVLPQYESEAKVIINGLMPQLKHLAGVERAHRIHSLFTASAIRKYGTLVWDPEKRCARSKDSVMLEVLLNNKADADFYCDMEVVKADEAEAATRQLLTNVDEASLGSGSTATVASYTPGQAWQTPAARGAQAFQTAAAMARQQYAAQQAAMNGNATIDHENATMTNAETQNGWAGTGTPMELQENLAAPLAPPEQGGWGH
jgi:hypothetical protein